MNFVRRKLPVLIVFLMGMVMMLRFYCPRYSSDLLLDEVNKWTMIIGGFTLVIGVVSLIRVHYQRVRRRQPGYGYSLVMYFFLFLTVLVGVPRNVGSLKLGIESGSPFMWIFENLNVPVSSAMFSILGFYVASAAYRAFRAKTFEAGVMLVAAVIVMFGRVPLADVISEPLPEWLKITNLTSWILNVPTVAARRAIILGMGLGSIATALKIIFGLERTYMGGGR
ncbi:MAG TPA: hypothetical protein PKH07_03525 [bacterium]|nr:hypothetical protein [bacterium]